MKKYFFVILLALPAILLGQTTFNKQIEYYQIGYYEQIPFEDPTLNNQTIYKEGDIKEKNGYVKVVVNESHIGYMNVLRTEFEIFQWLDKDLSKSYSEGDILKGNIKEDVEGWNNVDEYGDFIHPRKYVYISYEDDHITIFYDKKEKYSRYKLVN